MESGLGTGLMVDSRVPEAHGNAMMTSIAHVTDVNSSEPVLFAEPRSGRSIRDVPPSAQYPTSIQKVPQYFVCEFVQQIEHGLVHVGFLSA